MLAAGEPEPRHGKPVLDLVPEEGRFQALLDDGVQLRLLPDPRQPRAIDHVLGDAHRQGHGQGEEHPHPFPQGDHVERRMIDVLPIQQHLPLDMGVGREVVQAVQRPQERGLARAGRPDDAQDLVGGNVDRHPAQRFLLALEDQEIPDRKLNGMLRGHLDLFAMKRCIML